MSNEQAQILNLNIQDIPMVNIKTIGQNHIYVSWDRMNLSPPVSAYNIYVSDYFDGEYVLIATVPYPVNEFVHTNGRPTYYYKIEEINFDGSKGAISQPFPGDELLIKQSLAFEVKDLLRIPVHDEEVIFNRDRTQAHTAFTMWDYWPRPEIRISCGSQQGNQDPYIILSEYIPTYNTTNSLTANYPNGLLYKIDYCGRIYFVDIDGNPVSIHPYDIVLASYGVRMWSNSEMNSYLNMALQRINMQPGTNKYQSVVAAPYYYEPALVFGATYYMLRALLTRLTQRETRLLLDDPEKNDSISNLKEAANMYKEDFEEEIKTIAKWKYPNTVGIIVPEFMMPGGRSRFFRYAWGIGYSG